MVLTNRSAKGVGLRGPDRRADDPYTFRLEHPVEGTRELGVSVAQEEPNARKPLLDGKVPGLLGDPRRVRGVR